MIPNIIEFVTDPALLGLSVSPAQETLLRAVYGLPLTDEQFAIYRDCTGRTERPRGPFSEVTVIAGARAGKDSRIAAPVVLREALFGGHERHLSRGERAVIPLVAQDQRATRVAFGYIKDYLTGSSLLAGTVAEVLASEIVLTNGLAVYSFPCTLRSLRGWSIPAGVLDELAFFRMEGAADSDAEIQASVRRGMVGFPQTRLVKIGTPYMKSGVLFEDFKTGWGQNHPDLLVWRALSALMNPSLRQERLERERRLDPARFAREYEAEFAEDLDAFLASQWVEDAVVKGRHELPPREDVRYVVACDPSGGGADAFTLAICHAEGAGSSSRVTQDVMKGWSRVGANLGAVVAGNVRETSLRSYRDIVREHFIPALGRIPLRKLSPLDVQGYYTAKLNPPKPATGKTPRVLSAGTVRKHHGILHAALGYAVQNGTLAANVADRVKPPKRERKQPRRWDAERVKLVLGEMKRRMPHRLYTLFLTLRTTGIRPGEALGLREQDVDLLTGAITIEQKFYRLGGSKRDGEPTRLIFGPPKSEKGRRVIDIPPDLVEALRQVMAENAQLRKEFGAQYADLGDHGPLVFCLDDGRPLNWENIARRDYRRIVTRLKLPYIRPYEFGRHAHAAFLYEQGVHPSIISQRLGHADPGFTMRTYGYLDRGLQAPVTAKLQAWLSENAPK